ncbi:UNVERIFIED_CONTAM: hypothetical protein FKN15_009656 [Acipenser sinensis]
MIKLRDHPLLAQVENLEGDIKKLKKWSSNLTEKRAELQENLTALFGAVGKIEQSTATIAKDMSMKVSAVKTDVRRISGLESDVLALADSTEVLEEKVKQAEKMMVQKIGDLLAGSINRMTELKSSTDVFFVSKCLRELIENHAYHGIPAVVSSNVQCSVV